MSELYVTSKTDTTKTYRTARGQKWVWTSAQSYIGSLRIDLDNSGEFKITAGKGSTTEPSKALMSGHIGEDGIVDIDFVAEFVLL